MSTGFTGVVKCGLSTELGSCITACIDCEVPTNMKSYQALKRKCTLVHKSTLRSLKGKWGPPLDRSTRIRSSCMRQTDTLLTHRLMLILFPASHVCFVSGDFSFLACTIGLRRFVLIQRTFWILSLQFWVQTWAALGSVIADL